MSLSNEKQKYLRNFKGGHSPESVCICQPNKSSEQKKGFVRVHQKILHMGLTEELK